MLVYCLPCLISCSWLFLALAIYGKTSLKICQLCCTPLSLRAVCQGILLAFSLKSWKSVFLKFRALILLFTRPTFLRTVNSTGMQSLQPRLPPVLASPLMFVTNRLHPLWQGCLLPDSGSCAFQEPPEFPKAHYASFPADLKVVKVPQQDESLRAQCLL